MQPVTEATELERRWWTRDKPFTANGHRGPDRGPAWTIEARDHRVLLTAVHAVRQRRGIGVPKRCDARTGGLALTVAEATGASAAALLRGCAERDANACDDHPLKAALAAAGLVGRGTIVVDLHGMHDDHGFDVAIGAGHDREASGELAAHAADHFAAAGFAVDRDGHRTGLDGRRPGSVTTWAQRRDAIAIQVEIARRHRTFLTEPADRHRLLHALVTLVAALQRDAVTTAGPG